MIYKDIFSKYLETFSKETENEPFSLKSLDNVKVSTLSSHDFFVPIIGEHLYNQGLRNSIESYSKKFNLFEEVDNDFFGEEYYNPLGLLGCIEYVVSRYNEIVLASSSGMENFYKTFIYVFIDRISELFLKTVKKDSQLYSFLSILDSINELDLGNNFSINNSISKLLEPIGSIDNRIKKVEILNSGIDPIEKAGIITNLNQLFIETNRIISKWLNSNEAIRGKTLFINAYNNTYTLKSYSELDQIYKFQEILIRSVLASFIAIYSLYMFKK